MDGKVSFALPDWNRKMLLKRYPLGLIAAWGLMLVLSSLGDAADDSTPASPLPSASAAKPSTLLLAHYMPWFEAKPVSPAWGWHWTMNSANPDRVVEGTPDIASHFHPLIGPYDSGDPHVLEYHLLLMHLAGIDGVIVDWYGLQDFRDYALLHRNTQRLVAQVEQQRMKFAICYEDQTIPALVKEGRLAETARTMHAAAEIEWMRKNWFSLPSYVKREQGPLLLSFGQEGLSDQEWSAVLVNEKRLAYFSLHHRRQAAIGAFDWPLPKVGVPAAEQFQKSSSAWPAAIPVVFPRFHDFYAEAKVHESWGRIEDDGGRTLRKMLAEAATFSVVQIATWNDWGEGTQIEPSKELGYRDLELIQAQRRAMGRIRFEKEDLRLPARLLRCRRNQAIQEAHRQRLDQVAEKLRQGSIGEARELIDSLERRQ